MIQISDADIEKLLKDKRIERIERTKKGFDVYTSGLRLTHHIHEDRTAYLGRFKIIIGLQRGLEQYQQYENHYAYTTSIYNEDNPQGYYATPHNRQGSGISCPLNWAGDLSRSFREGDWEAYLNLVLHSLTQYSPHRAPTYRINAQKWFDQEEAQQKEALINGIL